MDAALRQFARHGFELASVKTIADGAGTSSGTVFWHFGSKSQLYCEVVRDAGDRVIRAMRPHLERDSLTLPELLDEWVRVLERNPEICGLLVALVGDVRHPELKSRAPELMNSRFMDFWRSSIASLERRGRISVAPGKSDLARLIVAASCGLLVTDRAAAPGDVLAPLAHFGPLVQLAVTGAARDAAEADSAVSASQALVGESADPQRDALSGTGQVV